MAGEAGWRGPALVHRFGDLHLAKNPSTKVEAAHDKVSALGPEERMPLPGGMLSNDQLRQSSDLFRDPGWFSRLMLQRLTETTGPAS